MRKENQSNVNKQAADPNQSLLRESSRSEYVVRDAILKLLSDQEIAAVTTAETLDRLAYGELFIDMEQLNRGVLVADQKKAPMGRVLPKKSVHKSTCDKIMKQLSALPAESSHVG